MSLPLTTLTYYRLADVAVGAATIVGLMDAIYTALIQTVDFHGNSLASTHLWTWARYQLVGVTEAVYCTGIPGGSGMTQAPRPIFGGRVVVGTPSMLSDTATASNAMVGLNLRGGAFNAWDAAAPFTSGVFSGYYRISAVGANAVTTNVRVFVSQETVLLQILQSSTSQYWCMVGAILEPWTNDVVNDAESDNRLYGQWTSGGGAICGLNLSAGGSNDPLSSLTTTNGNSHWTTFIPGTLTSGSGGQYQTGWCMSIISAVTATQFLTSSSAVLSLPVFANRTALGNALGRLREVYAFGSKQGALTYQVSGADKLHILATSNSGAANALSIRAA